MNLCHAYEQVYIINDMSLLLYTVSDQVVPPHLLLVAFHRQDPRWLEVRMEKRC